MLMVMADGTISCARECDGYRADIPPEQLSGRNVRDFLENPEHFLSAMRSVIHSAKPVTVQGYLSGIAVPRVMRIMPCLGGLGEHRQRALLAVYKIQEEEKWGT